MDNTPICKNIVPYLQHRGGRSVEAVLEGLAGEAAAYPERHSQLAGVRYFIQSMLQRVEREWMAQTRRVLAYGTLIDQMKYNAEGRALIVTFNYDRLVEWAMVGTGRIPNLWSYTNGPALPFPLFKVHGSTNWGRVMRPTADVPLAAPGWELARTLMAKAAQLVPTDRFEMQEGGPSTRHEVDFLFPAIAVPLQTKTTFECPPEHLAALVALLPRVDRIVSIGWRGADQHFVDLLTRLLPTGVEGLVVDRDGGHAAAITAELRGKVPGTFSPSEASGFSEFVVRRELDAFLAGWRRRA